MDWAGEDSRYITKNFARVRLVGAVIKISYIGTQEQESGFMTGSHSLNTTPFTATEDKIEEGYYATKARPSEGLRMTWLPTDEKDLEFHDADKLLNPVSSNEKVHADHWFRHRENLNTNGDGNEERPEVLEM